MKPRIWMILCLWVLFFLLFFSPFWRYFLVGKFYGAIGQDAREAEFLDACLEYQPRILFPSAAFWPYERLVQMASLQPDFSPELHMALLRVAELDPSLQTSYRNTALRLLVSQLQSPEINAQRYLDSYVSRLPESSIPHYLQARYLLSKGNKTKALSSLREANAKIPALPEVPLTMARIAMEDGQYVRVLQILGQNKQKIQPDFDFYSLTGMAHFHQNRWAEAAKPLEAALAIMPDALAEAKALGLIGARLGFPDYAEWLKKAFSRDSTQKDLALEYCSFLSKAKKASELLQFTSHYQLHTEEFLPLIARAHYNNQDLPALTQLLQTHAWLSEIAITKFYQGSLLFQSGRKAEGASLLQSWLSTIPEDQESRLQAYENLAAWAGEQKNFAEQRKWLTQQVRLDPARTDLMLEVSKTYEAQGDRLSRLRALLESVRWYPDQPDVLRRAINLLMELNAYHKAIELLHGSRHLYQGGELANHLIRAYMELGDIPSAQSVLRRMQSNQAGYVLPEELRPLTDAAWLARKAMEDLTVQTRVLYQAEQRLMDQVMKMEVEVRKNSLPPALSLAPQVTPAARVIRTYNYRGQAQTMIPEGTKVPIMDLPKRIMQSEYSAQDWYLARYEGVMHKIAAQYLKISFWPSDAGALGEAIVTNLDENFHTTAEVRERFSPGEVVEVISSSHVAPDQTIELDEDNVISFLSVPLKSYVVRRNTKTYYLFRAENLTIEPPLEFLSGYPFSDLHRIPSEQRLVAAGPDEGGVVIFAMDQGQSKILHYSRISSLPTGLSRPAYRGNMIMDVNGDDILDTIVVWQDRPHSERGLIQVAVSSGSGFQDILMPTDLSHIPNYQSETRISALNFLRDANEDGIMEFLLSEPVLVQGQENSRVPHMEWYQIAEGRKENISEKFPAFYREREVELDVLLMDKRYEVGDDNSLFNNFYQGYAKVQKRISEILATM